MLFIATLVPIRTVQEQNPVGPDHPVHALFSGLRFVWKTKPILATITLDLFAVLLGGATALLPMRFELEYQAADGSASSR